MRLPATPLKCLTALALCAAVVACGKREAETPLDDAPPPAEEPYPYEPVNLDLWLERLEVSSRELYSARAAVADAVNLPEGARIADVGAGTGLYTLIFAEKVGPSGVVFAEDIAPRFLTLINQRADDLGFDNVVSVLGRPDSITLPAKSLDAVFIADTYHYFDDPAAMMKTVFEALKPGGALYIVDYNLAEGETPPADKRHVRTGKDGVAAEVESYGFGKAEDIAVPGLSENYMLRFVRP
jgi:SAM-dependent methyltransferase